MAVVKFLVDTVHPDHGYVVRGEVLRVDRAYLDEYEELGIAEESEEAPDKREKVDAVPKGWGVHALPASNVDAV